MVRKRKPRSKAGRLKQLVEEIASLPLDALYEVFRQLYERGIVLEPEIILHDYEPTELVIDDHFGPVESVILRALKHDSHAAMDGDVLLRRVWPRNAPRVLDSGTAEERRALRQRLFVRVRAINTKLHELNESWRIVPVRETTGKTRYYFGEHVVT